MSQEPLNDRWGYGFAEVHFEFFRDFIASKAGIVLSEDKKGMVYNRLIKRLRSLEIATFSEYKDRILNDSSEFSNFVNALTTNHTYFFREPSHFDYLKNVVIPELIHKKKSGDRKIRIWCAASSTGEEPYTLAIVLHDAIPNIEDWDIRILCTDLDTDVLIEAERGIYAADRLQGLSADRIKHHFQKGVGRGQGYFRASARLRRILTFRRLNLIEPWPRMGPLDTIFCRNVMIYFSKTTRLDLFDRMHEVLSPGGYLFLGHSESLQGSDDHFETVGHSAYRKPLLPPSSAPKSKDQSRSPNPKGTNSERHDGSTLAKNPIH